MAVKQMIDFDVNPDSLGSRCYRILLSNRQKIGTNCYVWYLSKVMFHLKFVDSFPVWGEADLRG